MALGVTESTLVSWSLVKGNHCTTYFRLGSPPTSSLSDTDLCRFFVHQIVHCELENILCMMHMLKQVQSS